MSELKTFVLWNEHKAESSFNATCETLEQLLELEEKSGYSCSSTVKLTDEQLEQVIEAVHQEADLLLNYAELK